jgi:phosphoglycolate phosphatase-like HAD superfamily hydrolase
MLILFDIDATLIKTSGLGIRAMVEAGRELFGPSFSADGIEFAGRLDPLILNDMLSRCGVEVTASNLSAIRQRYRERLGPLLATGTGRALPGVSALLDELERRESVCLGLLTGNFAETGSMKLRACGIDPARFRLTVWGDESPHHPPRREHLPGVGLARFRDRFGREPWRTVVVGDTPHDVSCAKAHRCRALGVATGQFSVDQLLAAGADRAVPDLSETADVAAWLTE